MKLFRWISDNFMFVLTLFVLAFIPLYPKLPLLDIKHTWVYIRVEDFLVAFYWLVFFIQLARGKVSLKTPLTVPIIVFWIIGALATFHAILFLFPQMENVFPNIAILHWLRRIEYLSLFFFAFAAIRKKSYVTPFVITLAITMLVVVFYGIGQRYLGFPAFLTMNEEFAKGIPLRLSALSRVPSTFAGHYDLAAYLILLIPVIGSMVVGFKQWYAKIFFFLTAVSGLVLLMMTASRVSFAVYLLSITLLLILQKQKKFIIPVLIGSILLMQSFQGLSQRFTSTIQQVDLVVDARTGEAIGVASDIGEDGEIVIEDKQSTGENLPLGSKYINVPSSSGEGRETQITYKRLKGNDGQQEIITKGGQVIVKKAFAYDVSFTTRFQGQWPRAMEAFERNYFLGSGYSSISLATDNNYLRILGEVGLLGLLAYLSIFLVAVIYLWKVLPEIDDRKTRNLVYGVLAGIFGLGLNAILIDVFEASKVAFVLWTLLGVTLGLASLYQKKKIDYLAEIKRIFTSPPALIGYLVLLGFVLFAPMLNNYFAGDDFTWLRWAADCAVQSPTEQCRSFVATILHFFTDSQGFFYRPGTKTFFYVMYPVFELFPNPYHVVSLLLHLTATSLIFFLSRTFLKSSLFGFVTALLFLVMSVHAEAVLWISVTGHMIASVLILFALLCYVYWREGKHWILFVLAWLSVMVSMFFHEFGFTGSLLLIAYDLFSEKRFTRKVLLSKWYYLLLLLPIGIYYVLRVSAQSVWFQGDYSYNLMKLPFNVIGNFIGYILISVIGPAAHPLYSSLRQGLADNLLLAGIVVVLLLLLMTGLGKVLRKRVKKESLRIPLLSLLLFVIPLLPFLGLGNISDRYVYLSSFGIALLAAYLLQQVARSGRKVWLLLSVIVVLFFIYSQYNQLMKVNQDWQRAGEITNNTLVSLNYAYAGEDANLPKNPEFVFINVPIKYGDAWIFPVGLSDALWFSFQNTNLKVTQTQDEEAALQRARKARNVRVFKFLPNGDLVELAIETK